VSSVPDRLSTALADRYRIERELGEGGMATVYLAQDLKHDRKVALKVLRPDLAAVIGAERFLQEIKTTANLQHPHILALFDSGQVSTTDPVTGDTTRTVFYVMPFVEGESLRDRLTREKQLPVADAVRIAGEVASALDYAHRRGVIHRDIKPENILLHDAQALVADFGIALAASRSEGGSRMTETGMSLGTPHYMSPEQAMGERNLDARTDVYALGCVLYEMLTGEPPFTGPTAQAIVARVMTEVPRSVTRQRKAVPPHVEAAVLTALEKLPADRFATAAEFLTALGDTSRRVAPTGSAVATGAARGRRALPWVVALLALGVAVVSVRRLAQVPAATPLRFTLAPHGADVSTGSGLATSPDGRTIVYAASLAGVQRLYRRTLDNPVAVPLLGTEGVREAAFSPDGRWVLFSSTDDRIKKISVEGGTVVSLVRTTVPAGITWSAGIGPVFGMPAFSRNYHGLTSVPERGDTGLHVLTMGPTGPGTSADSVRSGPGGMDHEPFALADGRTVLFVHFERGPTQLGVLSLADRSSIFLDLAADEIVGVADGVLLYLDNPGNLMAVRFDAGRRRISGVPVRVADIPGRVVEASMAANGTLAMRLEPAAWQVVLVDERGVGEPLLPDTVGDFSGRFSPDGRRVAVNANLRRLPALWAYEFGTGSLSRLASGPQLGRGGWVEWSGDGRNVIEGGVTRLLIGHASDGSGRLDTLAQFQDARVINAVLAPDQSAVAYTTAFGAGGFNVMVRRLSGDTIPVRLAATEANETAPRFSPDGRWIAYSSDESGRYEVYAKSWPGPGTRVQISEAGGEQPVWSRDGRRLFYRSGQAMLAVDLTGSGSAGALGVSRREQLFAGDFYLGDQFLGRFATYDVAPDGHHFLMAQAVSRTGTELVVWTGWLTEFKKKLMEAK